MCSDMAKVMHTLAGKPMLQWVIEAAQDLNPAEIFVVYGHAGEQLQRNFSHLAIRWIAQAEQLGTGHALAQVLPHLQLNDEVMVLCGDVPLISSATLAALLNPKEPLALSLVVAELADPTGLGRILRDSQHKVVGIKEEKDASESERKIQEIYAGMLATTAVKLQQWLPKLSKANAQGEYYLTQIVDFAVQEGLAIHTVKAKTSEEIQGVNTRAQLAELERYYQRWQAEKLLAQGVSLLDPARIDVRGKLSVGIDTIIDVNVVIEGTVVIGKACYIGPNVVLKNVTLADHVRIEASCVVEGAVIGASCHIGPFARLRPGTQLAMGVKIGNFVEIKQATIDYQSKVNHLSYIGDAILGQQVNVGAGSITCNYDGANKHITTIGDAAFIGSNTALVAPVVIGAGATIGAGSTITKDTPAGQLTLSRSKQQTLSNWQRPVKKSRE
jgi:bifunctional UDP-N-acetylglucosamine pyrophosphorylase/glucosamine-1-phosphate N-acetyltransferase